MNTQLTFLIELPYDKTNYENLKRISLFNRWNKEKKVAEWVFPMKKIKEVELYVGKPILVPEYREQFNKEVVNLEGFKGADKIEIREYPKIYQIVEHRKEETEEGHEIKEIKHEIPRALVDTLYKEIVAHQPLNKPISTETVCDKICTLLALKRFFREDTGSFDFQKFFGARKDYYTYFYLPTKVLVHLGKVRHHKSGKIERLV